MLKIARHDVGNLPTQQLKTRPWSGGNCHFFRAATIFGHPEIAAESRAVETPSSVAQAVVEVLA